MTDNDELVIESDDESLEGEGSTAEKLAEKIKKLRVELAKANSEKQEYLDGWHRAKADYVNIRKRTEDERHILIRDASLGLVKALLPVLDSFDQALETASEQSAWLEGIKNTHAQFMKVLESESVTAFNPIGEQFDPNMHEPVERVAVKTPSEDNTVTKVYQKGYKLHGTIIRPARVAVGHYES